MTRPGIVKSPDTLREERIAPNQTRTEDREPFNGPADRSESYQTVAHQNYRFGCE